MNNFFQNKTALFTLIAASIITLSTMGVRQTFGLFSSDFEVNQNISTLEFGFAIAFHSLIWGIFTIVFGRMGDKYGGRRGTIIALVLYSIAIYALGNNFSSGIWFQINLGLLVGLGLAGAAGTIMAPQVTKHFPNHNRAKAASIVTAFGGLGMFIFPIMTNVFKNQFSWEATLIIFSIVLIIMLIPAFFLRLPENYETQAVTSNTTNESALTVLKKSLKHRGFRLLILGFFVCGFQITLIATHVPKYVAERGLSDWTGFAILALIGLFNIFGTLLMGILADKYSKKILLSGLYFLRGITLMIFIFLPPSDILAVFFGISFGMLWLATVPATNGIVAQVFGTKNISLLFGVVFLNHQIGSFLGAFLGGWFYENFGSFDYAWYLAIFLSFVATLLHLPIDERPLEKETVTP
ncbi:MAG: MFS transporter [Pseudomonadota bacterium]|nr:MFS transporter [Pseudomonadota bacterium]